MMNLSDLAAIGTLSAQRAKLVQMRDACKATPGRVLLQICSMQVNVDLDQTVTTQIIKTLQDQIDICDKQLKNMNCDPSK